MTNPLLDDARLHAAANPTAQFQPNTGHKRADEIFTANNVALDPKVATSLHPGSLSDATIVGPLMADGVGRAGEEVLLSATSWLKSAHESQTLMNAALEAAKTPHQGPLGTTREIPEHLKPELAQGFAQQFQKVSQRFTKQIESVATAVTTLQAQIDATLQAPDRSTTAFAMATSGLGLFMMSLKGPGKQMEFLSQAVADSDLRVIGCVLDRQFSSYNFGISEKERGLIRQMAELKFAKPLCAARDAAAKVHGHMISACQTFTETFKRQCPQPSASPQRDSAIAALRH